MRNTTSLFLMLISYLITLGAILALLFTAMPLSLQAQTNPPMETNLSSAVARTNPPVAGTNQGNPSVRIDDTGIHIGGANPVNVNFPHDRKLGLGLGTTLVSVMPFIFPVAILAVIFYFKHRRNKLAHETLRLIIEKGVPVTPELIASLNLKAKQDEAVNLQARYLLPGLILVGVGVAALAVAGKPGLIFLFIGVAFLIVWLVERKNRNNPQPPRP